jgi:hypothetical protein
MNRQNLAFLLVILATVGGAVFYVQRSGEADLSGALDDVKRSVSNLGTVNAYTDAGVVVNAESYEARIQKALGAVASEPMSDRPLEIIGKVGGDIWTDAPALVTGLDGKTVKSIWDDPEVKAALLASDEEAAAKLIRGKGGTFLVLHHRVSPSVDRARKVMSRLYHHDYLELFSLTHVSNGLYTYIVREKPLAFPPQLASATTLYLRAKLAGSDVPAFPDIPSEVGSWDIIASIRADGTELAIALGKSGTLKGALDEVAEDLEIEHRRHIEIYGFPPLKDHVKDLTIEVHRLYERAEVEPRAEKVLEALWEMGVDGALILRTFEGKLERGILPGSVGFTRSVRTADEFLREAALVGHMSEKRPWRDPEAHLEILRDVHYLQTPDGQLQRLYRGVPPIPLSKVTIASTQQAVLRSAEWYLNNIQPDGSVTYKMWPSENRYSDEYNHVRHTLATWNLAQAWLLDPRPEYLEVAERAQDWTMKYLVEEDGMAYYSYDHVNKLGSVVVGLLGMIDLSRAKKTHEWDELMKRQGKFVQAMQTKDGKFEGYYKAEGTAYEEAENDIVPGEAALSLIYLADYFGDDSWMATLPQYWTYYYPWFRERAKKSDPNAPWPWYIYNNDVRLELVQFGPWTVMAADAYYRRTKDEDVGKFGLEVARWMIDAYEWTSDNAPFPDYIGGYYKLPDELPAMQAFCYGEGTAAAYSLALQMGNKEEAAFFEKRTRETVRFGMQMQYDERTLYPFTRKKEVFGGIRYAMTETKIRIDYVHHGLSAMYQYQRAAQQDPNLPPEVRAELTGEALAAPTPAVETARTEKAPTEG